MKDYKREVYEIMKELGALPHIKGYDYSVFLINKLLTGEIDRNDKIMYMYSVVAKKFNTTASRVERAIRHFIERIFDSFANRLFEEPIPKVIDKYFGINSLDVSNKVPNSQFIFAIVEYIKVNTNEVAE